MDMSVCGVWGPCVCNTHCVCMIIMVGLLGCVCVCLWLGVVGRINGTLSKDQR